MRTKLAVAVLSLFTFAASAAAADRYLVVARSPGDLTALRAQALAAGAQVVGDIAELNTLVVLASPTVKAKLAAAPQASGIARDRVVRLVRPDLQQELFGTDGTPRLRRAEASGLLPAAPVTPDPLVTIKNLTWDLWRINAPAAWGVATGTGITVAIADTGLDYTHPELSARVANVVDLTTAEDPPLCKTYFGTSDQELAATYGGPVDTDWNGHGSWCGGNVGAALDQVGYEGIAPNVKLVALKISGWCGSAYDSTILSSFLWAANHGVDVVSISFGGYLDLRDREQALIYARYLAGVQYAKARGTLIVSSAGNDHLRLGALGLVMSHGPLTSPASSFTDYYGLLENPAGVPGVVMVSSTGNYVASSSPSCPTGTFESTNASCKPESDAHQAPGTGLQDQLAYYSNYGPRVDLAAPGGARKFNLPAWDRGGTPGWPFTDEVDATAFENFGITSNWATQIPCFFISPYPLGYPDACYAVIQGTSMAAPHVSAVAALVASKFPALRHRPDAILARLKNTARHAVNLTAPLSGTDLSPGDQTGVPCTHAWCHLGGPAIPSAEAYGAGIVDAAGALGAAY